MRRARLVWRLVGEFRFAHRSACLADEVRWFVRGGGYSPLAKSNKLVVDDTDNVLVTPIGGGKLSVVCDVASREPHARHWLAVFAAGESDNHNYIGTYAYAPAWKQPVLLDAPRGDGDFEVRLLQRGSYDLIKASQVFHLSEGASK